MIDLSTLSIIGKLRCPWCNHVNAFVYKNAGVMSCACKHCSNMVLWDCEQMKAHKASIKKTFN